MARTRRLGTGTYQVEVRERGTEKLVGLLAHSRLSWSRGLDDMSSAEVVVAPVDEYQVRQGVTVDVLAEIDEWEHELWIWRDSDREPVWLGPLTPPPTFVEGAATVRARDLFAWFERRFQPRDHQFTDTDLSAIFGIYAEDTLALENSMGMRLRTSDSGILGTRSVSAVTYPRTADLLRELGRVGVDFTMLRRTLIVGGIEISTPDLPTLVDDLLLNPQVDPVPRASRVVVIGGSVVPGAALPIGVAEDVDSPIGLVEVQYPEPLILDQASLDQAAQTRLDFLNSGAVLLTATLHPDSPVDFDTLVPGAHCHVQLLRLARPIDTEMRLVALDVTHDVADTETESVVATFSPLGSVAI